MTERAPLDHVFRLVVVGNLLRQAGVKCAVVLPINPVDVPYISAGGPEEIVCSLGGHGGYHLWEHGQPKQFNLTAEDAAQALIKSTTDSSTRA